MVRSWSRSRPRRGVTATRGRVRRAALVVLRVLIACLALQMSGVLHFVVDLWLEGEAAAAHFAEGEGDGDDDEDCPPGCPTCHCVHASPALPIVIDPLACDALPAYEVVWAPYEARTPPSLAPPSVYRPPRG